MNNYKSYLEEDGKFNSGTFKDATPKLEAYLKKHGQSSTGLFGFNSTIRYNEGVLELNEEVVVLGTVQRKDPKKYNLEDNYSDIVVLTSSNNEPLILTDTTKAKPKRHG